MPSVATKYLAAQATDRSKRVAIGSDATSRLQYTDPDAETEPGSEAPTSCKNANVMGAHGTLYVSDEVGSALVLFRGVGAIRIGARSVRCVGAPQAAGGEGGEGCSG